MTCSSPRSTLARGVPAPAELSAGYIFGGVVRPLEPPPPEYVTLPASYTSPEEFLAIAQWNTLWEAAQFRRRFFDLDDLPQPMARIADLGDFNVTFVPRTRARCFEYAPLFHLLPKRVLDMFGLPLLRGGQWPFMADWSGIDDFLPPDFEERLARAWAWTVWPHLVSGSKMKAFSADDPIRLLAHNLDFWVPAVTATIQERLRDFPEVDKGKTPGPVILEDGSVLAGAVAGNPRMGGQVWFGEDDARDAVVETVAAADRTGRLRGILDAFRSPPSRGRLLRPLVVRPRGLRTQAAREAAQGGGEVRRADRHRSRPGTGERGAGQSDHQHFLTLLDGRNRQIVVLLNSGVTSKIEIADVLGYANHSAVSTRLAQIRRAAQAYFDEN